MFFVNQSIYVKRFCATCKKDFTKNRKDNRRYCSFECRPSSGLKSCKKCGIEIIGRFRFFCDPCVQIRLKECADAKRVHRPEEAEKTRKGARKARERNAVGLNQHQRKRLLNLWVSQARECSYCYKSADTIDHLIPLFRGGTNEITNLVPSCRPCNSSKGSKLVSEWKPNARTNT